MENIIISKEFLDWYEYYNKCKEKYSGLVSGVENKEYIKLDRDKSTFKSHRDFSSEIEITFKHL